MINEIESKIKAIDSLFEDFNLVDFRILPFKLTLVAKKHILAKINSDTLAYEDLEHLEELLSSLIKAMKKQNPGLVATFQDSIIDQLEMPPWDLKNKIFVLDSTPFINSILADLQRNQSEALREINCNEQTINELRAQSDDLSRKVEIFLKLHDNAILACDCLLDETQILEHVKLAKNMNISLQNDLKSRNDVADILEELESKTYQLNNIYSEIIDSTARRQIGSHLIHEKDLSTIDMKTNFFHLKPHSNTNNLFNYQIHQAIIESDKSYKNLLDMSLENHDIEVIFSNEDETYIQKLTEGTKEDILSLNIDNLQDIKQELALNLAYRLAWESELKLN